MTDAAEGRRADGASPEPGPAPSASCTILLFVRAPGAGRVKTRLAAEIGPEAALRVYRRLAEHAAATAGALAGEADLRIHFTPAGAGDAVRAWLGAGADYRPQVGDDDLGVRMRCAFEAAFAAGYARVVIIGSDLPELSAEALRRAFALLDSHRAVLGPARDGGYWLLGLREMVPGVFDGIEWSTDAVFAATVERLHAAACEPALLEVLGDVDQAADLPPGWRAWACGGAEVAA